MTIGTLVLYICVAGLILTVLMGFTTKAVKNWPLSFLQNAVGALFIFSGWVKAIDPLGTAYKLEQYFAEFELTFEPTWFSFLAPFFKSMSGLAVELSVFMIVFEIILGIMLILGARPKLAAWLFFLLVVFFTFLTGFTYLTGYVPREANFFSFSQWVAFQETNMRVTDCGCFGDFIKLKPFTSFMKDVVLLVPGLLFILFSKRMHQLWTPQVRSIILGVSTVALIIYCMNNYVWNLPHIDFRPFREGVNVAAQKTLEEEAAANVQILGYKMTQKETGEVVELPYEQYLKEFKNYPKEQWALEQIKTEPAIEATKISDFELSDVDGNDVTESILEASGYHIMIVAHKIPYQAQSQKIVVSDTTYLVDTVYLPELDSTAFVKAIDQITQRDRTEEIYTFKEKYLKRYTEVVNPVLEAATKAGIRVYGATALADPAMIEDFRHATQSAYPFYMGDDILLKTIVRSNPGVVLWKDGTILKKWHFTKLPSFEEIQRDYIR